MSATLTPWIINRRQDLFWFSGSALFGYLLIAIAFAFGGLPGMFLILFAFAIDGPHVFSTLTRALMDSSERSNLSRLWLFGFPACVASIFTLALLSGADTAFIVVAGLSAYHIAKQHMGFVMIYKRKARDRDGFKLDKYFTLASLLLPFGYYVSALLSDTRVFLPAFLAPALAIALFYSARQLKKQSINGPKILLLAAFIPLQWFAWSYAAVEPHSITRLVVAGVAMNVGHSFQYLRLMYFHNHNRYSERSGLLGFISRKPLYFVAAVIVLALPNFFSIQLPSSYLSAIIVGMLLFHFILDSRIWRVRGDKALAEALRL